MADPLVLDATFVRQKIDRLKADYPELLEDAELLESTIEGETDFERVIERITDAFLDAVSMKEAVASRSAALKERGDRYDRKADAMKALALILLASTGQRSIRLPQATLTIAQGRSRTIIEDEDALPQGYVKFERVPIKADIAAALAAGDQIPGARLEAAPDYLTVRTK